MSVKYSVQDSSHFEAKEIGVLELRNGADANTVIRLATSGLLNLVKVKTEADLRAIMEEQAKNEAALEDPEGHLERVQAEIDAEAEARKQAVLSGEIPLEELSLKQLHWHCDARDIPRYGKKEDLIARIREFDAALEAAEEVNLSTLTVKELRKVAKGYNVSAEGTKEELIARIEEAAEALAAEEGEGDENEEEKEAEPPSAEE